MAALIEKLKKYTWLIILIAAVILCGYGIYRGEPLDVFEKARIICLECIGIG